MKTEPEAEWMTYILPSWINEWLDRSREGVKRRDVRERESLVQSLIHRGLITVFLFPFFQFLLSSLLIPFLIPNVGQSIWFMDRSSDWSLPPTSILLSLASVFQLCVSLTSSSALMYLLYRKEKTRGVMYSLCFPNKYSSDPGLCLANHVCFVSRISWNLSCQKNHAMYSFLVHFSKLQSRKLRHFQRTQ